MLTKSIKSALGLALAAAVALAGHAGAAEARCAACNVPISKTSVRTVVKTTTVRPVRNVTRYRDVTRNRYVKHVTRVVHRTVVQPITRVNTVTRVHHRTFVVKATQHVSRTTTVASRVISGGSRTVHVRHRPVTMRSCGCN